MLLVLQAVMEGGESKKVFVGLEYQKTIRKIVYHVCFLPPIFYKKNAKRGHHIVSWLYSQKNMFTGAMGAV